MTHPTEGLRDRRRRQTTADIQLAALELIEAHGWEAATVARISEAAGISSRTFFRYFDSKEQAALPSQRRLWESCVAFTVEHPTYERAKTAIIEMLRSALLGDDGHSEVPMHRRVARLFVADPHLNVLAGAQDAEYVAALHRRLHLLLPAHNSIELRALAEYAMVIWRTAWWHWSTELSEQPAASPTESFELAVHGTSLVAPIN